MKARTDVELLAELEKELVELQTTIAVLKRRIGIVVQGTPASSGTLVSHSDERVNHSIDKPYLGMNILDASRKFLQKIREPKSPAEIAEALAQGGVHSRSDDFNGIVRTTLFKRGHEVGIEKFGKGKWGLQDWRPGRTRSPEGGESEA